MMGINSEGMLISAVHEEDGHECLNLLMVDDKIPAGAKLYQDKKMRNFWCKFTHLRQTYANLKWKDNYKTRVEIVLCDTASTLFLYQQMIL